MRRPGASAQVGIRCRSASWRVWQAGLVKLRCGRSAAAQVPAWVGSARSAIGREPAGGVSLHHYWGPESPLYATLFHCLHPLVAVFQHTNHIIIPTTSMMCCTSVSRLPAVGGIKAKSGRASTGWTQSVSQVNEILTV